MADIKSQDISFDVGFVPQRMRPPIGIVNSAKDLLQQIGSGLETHIQSQITPNALFSANTKGLIQGNINSSVLSSSNALGDIKARIQDGVNSGLLLPQVDSVPVVMVPGYVLPPGFVPSIKGPAIQQPGGRWFVIIYPDDCSQGVINGDDPTTIPGIKKYTVVSGPYPNRQLAINAIDVEGPAALACKQNLLGIHNPLPPILNPQPPIGGFIPGPPPPQPIQGGGQIVTQPIPPPPPPNPIINNPVIIGGGTIITAPIIPPSPPVPISVVINNPIPPKPIPPSPPQTPQQQPQDTTTVPFNPPVLIDSGDIVGKSFCERFLDARDLAADYGNKLIAGSRGQEPGKVNLQNLFGKIRIYMAVQPQLLEGSHAVLSFFQTITEDSVIVNTETQFRKWITEVYQDGRYSQVDGLYAIRTVLQIMAGWKVNIGADSTWTYTFSAKGTPQLFGFGAGVDTNTVDSTHGSHQTTISPALSSALDIIDLMIKITLGLQLPSIPDCITGYLHGDISYIKLQCLIQYNGGQWSEYVPVINASRKQLTIEQVIEIGKRTKQDDKTIRSNLRNLGILDDKDVSSQLELYNEIPPLNTLISFAFNGVTSDQLSEAYGLDDGLPEAFSGSIGDSAKALGITEDWFKLYWRNHWQKPGMGELTEAARRLRPGRVVNDLEVTKDDYQNFSLRNGVPNWWSKRQLELSYTPISIRFLKYLFETGVIDETELIDFLRDAGYSPDNAAKYKNVIVMQARRELSSKGVTLSLTQALDGYFAGTLPLTEIDELGDYLGYTQDQVELAIEAHEYKFDLKISQQRLSALRKEYMHGSIDEITVTSKLSEMGIAKNHVDMYVNLWNDEITADTKQISVHTLIDWFKKGIISLDDLSLRLYRLHFTPDDVSRIESSAIMDMQILADKEQAKELAQQQRQKEKALKAYQQQRARDLAASARQAKESARQAAVLAKQAETKAAENAKQQKRDNAKASSEAAKQANKLANAIKKQMLAELKGEYDERVADVRANEIVELSELTDKTAKAELRAEVERQLAEMKEEELNLEGSVATGLPQLPEGPE